ncbi:MAG: hypothetical protein II883_10075 [Spirochaetales bacterium]|nr:hypothetical protein [Spirochaetales bacterium]
MRQIGKTFSVMQFARENCKSVVYMNFKKLFHSAVAGK